MAYLDREVAAPGSTVEVHIIGIRRKAKILPGPAFDPEGSRMRA